MIINTPALDYYRATTGVFNRYYDMVQELVGFEEVDQKWKFQQYEGNRVGAVGHGQAQQGGQDSYIIDIPGETADDMLYQLVYSDMKPTRIDMQITIARPEYWDTLDFYFQMKLGAWPNVPRQVTARLSDGADTVYIGSRESDRYIRVYVKERHFIRFEVEFKKKLAVKAWDTVRKTGRTAIAGILMAEIEKLPKSKLLDDCTAQLLRFTGDSVNLAIGRVNATDERKVQWLASLLPTIEQMMNDSDYGRTVTGWFLDMVERKVNQ